VLEDVEAEAHVIAYLDDVRIIAVRALEVLDHHPEILTGLVELPSPVSGPVGARGLQEPAKETRKTRAFIRRWIGDVRCYNVGPELRRTRVRRTFAVTAFREVRSQGGTQDELSCPPWQRLERNRLDPLASPTSDITILCGRG
jgi:hypothetical protein